MKILADSSLPLLQTIFRKPFRLTLYKNIKDVHDLINNQDILLCRSTLKIDDKLFINSSVPKCIGTISSGIDHISIPYIKKHAIKFISAKGKNADSVVDYVMSTIAILQKLKLLIGKKVVIIGVGTIGSKVAKRLLAINMNVFYRDPFRKKIDKDFPNCSLKELTTCDLICIHVNLHNIMPYPSFNLLNENIFSNLKHGCIIINTSRGGVVNEKSLLKYHKNIIYCTDVFNNEPKINKKIIDFSTICTPHIAGHSIDAIYKSIFSVSKKIYKYFNVPIPSILTKKISLNCNNNINKYIFDNQKQWQEIILSIYNPIYETQLLKGTKANEISKTFSILRSLHKNRYCFSNFIKYFKNKEIINKIMGGHYYNEKHKNCKNNNVNSKY